MSSNGRLPKVGFLGVGWIGLARLEALAQSGLVEICGVCDQNEQARDKALALAPRARSVASYEELLSLGLDGIVIATPSALHAEQCVTAFERGAAVFCQKPLARTLAETQLVVDAAAAADRLLRVDLCYRETQALRRTREVVRSGEIGKPFAVEVTFHNAYGPDKAWAQDLTLAGGGCLIDLGVHLVDAVMWILEGQSVQSASARLFRDGNLLGAGAQEVEDFAVGMLTLEQGVSVSLACSWRSSFGDPASIRVRFFGTRGGVSFENVEGSFYDFKCEQYSGPSRSALVTPPDAWGGRAIVAWANELRESPCYRPANDLLAVARTLDALYGRLDGSSGGVIAGSQAGATP